MLHNKFQISEACGSEEDFSILLTYFYDSNLRLSGKGPLWAPGPPFE